MGLFGSPDTGNLYTNKKEKKPKRESSLSNRDKNLLKLLFVFLVLGGIVVTFIYPEFINYEYALKDLKLKENRIEELKRDLDQKDSAIESNISLAEQLELEKIQTQNEANTAMQTLSQTDLRLHIPSLLITLEQNAKENNISLLIKYDQKNTYTSSNNNHVIDYIDETGEVPLSSNIPEENSDIIMEEKETPSTSIENQDIHTLDSSYIASEIPTIEGIDVTSIPLEINGTYNDVREFINFLDTIDFLEPSFIDLYSDGEYIKGVMALHILHEGVK